jgi:hypothetical protein
MKRQFLFGTVLAAAMAVGVGAQTPDPASPQTPPQSPTAQSPTSQTPPASPSMDKQSSKAGQTVTLTGCVERGSAGGATAGTTGATSPSAGASQFVLKNVAPGGGASSSTAGTSGTTISPSWQNGLNLSAGSEDLDKHVNHKVEIKGKVDTASASATGAASSSDMPTLKISSIKDLADTCSGGGQ